MQPSRRQWFFNIGGRRDKRRVLKAFVIVAGGFAGLMALAMALDAWWLMPLAIVYYFGALYWMMRRVVYEGEPCFWCVGRRGLTAVRWPFLWRTHPWSSIHDVVQFDDTAVLQTARGEVPLGRNTLNWRRLADLVRLGIGQEVAPEAEDDLEVTIAPEIVAGWLGLGPGEVLRLRVSTALRVALSTLGVAMFVGLQAWLAHSWAPILWALLAGLVAGALLRRTLRQQNSTATELKASGEALEVKCQLGWRRISWGALRRLEARPWKTHILSTTNGDVVLSGQLARRQLLTAIEQAIAARRAGEVLPRVTGVDVPEAALSRVVGGSSVSERAVSRTGPS